jgi:hypothetical protein
LIFISRVTIRDSKAVKILEGAKKPESSPELVGLVERIKSHLRHKREELE